MNIPNCVVWVDGNEVVEYYVTKEVAERIKEEYIADGYDDTQIEITNSFMR